MKTQILQLEPHDDIISTRDKMGWGQTGRIVLVWPKNEPILTRRLDLLLLQRHSTTLGAQLAFVTNDQDVKHYAKELNIPVFKNLRQAQSERWRAGRRHRMHIQRQGVAVDRRAEIAALRQELHPAQVPPAWLESRSTRLALVLVGAAILLAVLVLLVPSASISLQPDINSQETDLNVVASSSAHSANLSGEVPAERVTVRVESSAAMTTTGRISVPENAAAGRIQFTNLTNQPVSVPAGTVITTLPAPGKAVLSFETTEPVQVPAGAGQTSSAEIRAQLPGGAYNLSENSLVAIEGSLGLSLSATNTTSTRGGTDRLAFGPSQDDYQRLYDQLMNELRGSALAELQSTRAEGERLITPTLALSTTLVKLYNPELITTTKILPASQLHLHLQAEFQALQVKEADLRAMGNGLLDTSLPTGFSGLSDSLEWTFTSSPVLQKDGSVLWKMHFKRTTRTLLAANQVARLVVGLTSSQARVRMFETYPLQNLPRVLLSPSWWPRLPLLPARIEVSW